MWAGVVDSGTFSALAPEPLFGRRPRRRVLMFVEIAMTFFLVSATGLFGKSLLRLHEVSSS